MFCGRLLETENKRIYQMSCLKTEWSRSLKKFEKWTLTREFLKRYLTEKQTVIYISGRLREVVAMRELTVIIINLYCANSILCSNAHNNLN